jgi:hypothetical protein
MISYVEYRRIFMVESLSSTLVNGDMRVYHKVDLEDGMIYEFAYHTGGNKWVARILARYKPGQGQGEKPSLNSIVTSITTYDGSAPRVYYIDFEGDIYELAWNPYGNQWSPKNLFIESGIYFHLPPKARHTSTVVNSFYPLTGDPRVLYTYKDLIHELSFEDKWLNHYDLVKMDPIDKNSPLTSIGFDGFPRVYYLTNDGHVHQINLEEPAVVDLHIDVTKIAKRSDGSGKAVPPAAVGSALTATLGANSSSHFPCIYYLGKDRHIHELSRGHVGKGVWRHRDLVDETFGLPATDGSALASTDVKGGYQRVYYIGSDRHVHELAYGDDHEWSHKDISCFADNYPPNWWEALPSWDSPLTAVTYGTKVTGNPAIGYNVIEGIEPRVYYCTDHKVHELGWHSETASWRYENVSSLAQWI